MFSPVYEIQPEINGDSFGDKTEIQNDGYVMVIDEPIFINFSLGNFNI